jgi:hypothetical protein
MTISKGIICTEPNTSDLCVLRRSKTGLTSSVSIIDYVNNKIENYDKNDNDIENEQNLFPSLDNISSNVIVPCWIIEIDNKKAQIYLRITDSYEDDIKDICCDIEIIYEPNLNNKWQLYDFTGIPYIGKFVKKEL